MIPLHITTNLSAALDEHMDEMYAEFGLVRERAS